MTKLKHKLITILIFGSVMFGGAWATPANPNPLSTGSITGPPARICGNSSILTSPYTSPPPGLNVVKLNPSENINPIVSSNPNGTIFWFAPGVYYLGTGLYGQIQPRQGDQFIGAPNAIIDGNHQNLIAFAPNGYNTEANNVVIKYLTIRNFGGPFTTIAGAVVNQGGTGDNWTVENDVIMHNGGAGVMLGPGMTVEYDCLTLNGEYGFQGGFDVGSNGLYAGRPTNTIPAGIKLEHDEISFNDADNIDANPGSTPDSCGCTGGGKFWQSYNDSATYDWVHNNFNVGLWVDTDNIGLNISNDYIQNNYAEGIIYEISYNAKIAHDLFVGNANGGGPYVGGFPDPAIYVSESGGNAKVSNLFPTLNISNNTFLNNWGGVVAYENTARYCNDGSDGSCTFLNQTVTNPLSGVVYAINTATNTMTGTIPIGTGGAYEVAFSPTGSVAYAINEGSLPSDTGKGFSISVINTTSNSVVNTISLGEGPFAVAFNPSGTLAYVTETGYAPYATGIVDVVNTESNTVVDKINVGQVPLGVAFNPSGTLAYVTNYNYYSSGTVSVINVASNSVVNTINVNNQPIGVTFNPSGTLAYVADSGSGTVSVINVASNSVVNTIDVGTNPYSIGIDPSGSLAYITNEGSGTVSVINTASNSVVNTIPVGTGPFGVTFNLLGSLAYVTNSGSGTVSVINVASNSVVNTIDVGTEPDGISLSPSGSLLYIANTTSCLLIPINEMVNPSQYWGCRWRTQNVTVANNYFMQNLTKIPCNIGGGLCGYQGLFAVWGYPPYSNYVIGSNITYFQNNHFNNNTYVGNWLFMPYEQGITVNSLVWQGNMVFNPNCGGCEQNQHVNQDVNSIFIS